LYREKSGNPVHCIGRFGCDSDSHVPNGFLWRLFGRQKMVLSGTKKASEQSQVLYHHPFDRV
jgi:hypothetical protein